MNRPESLLQRCATALLKPAIRFCVRRSLAVQEVTELIKSIYVHESISQIERQGAKVSVSKVSVMTGLRRREVARLMETPETKVTTSTTLTKVIGKWLKHPDYITGKGTPRVLTSGTQDSEFNALVASVTTDVNPGTVLAHLLHSEIVTTTPRGIKLLTKGYLPSKDEEASLHMLALDLDDLTLAVEENVYRDTSLPNLHATTEYDAIPAKHAAALRSWLLKEGDLFHRKIRLKLASLDQDTSPTQAPLSADENGMIRVVAGSFSRISSMENQ